MIILVSSQVQYFIRLPPRPPGSQVTRISVEKGGGTQGRRGKNQGIEIEIAFTMFWSLASRRSWGKRICPILKIKKLKLREGEQPAHGHTARRLSNQNSNTSLTDCEAHSLSPLHSEPGAEPLSLCLGDGTWRRLLEHSSSLWGSISQCGGFKIHP